MIERTSIFEFGRNTKKGTIHYNTKEIYRKLSLRDDSFMDTQKIQNTNLHRKSDFLRQECKLLDQMPPPCLLQMKETSNMETFREINFAGIHDGPFEVTCV